MEGKQIARKELVTALKTIIRNDKTEYTYSGKKSLNRLDEAPKKGRRWLTPREIAASVLREMGDHNPYGNMEDK